MKKILSFLAAFLLAQSAVGATQPAVPSSVRAAAAAAGAQITQPDSVLPQPGPLAPQPPTEMINPDLPPDSSKFAAPGEVFGSSLFSGAFAKPGATQFNPDYLVSVGDKVQVRLWGGYNYDNTLTVDPQGNIFLPYYGPLKVMDIRNRDLQETVDKAVRSVFRTNVSSYANLASAQPVRVFVGGYVTRPGLYNGTSMDSLLNFLDQAGGIDPALGTYLGVQIKRGTQVRAKVNLYDFLLDGVLPLIQLSDGDVIFVPARQNTVKVSGLAENAKRFEFDTPTITVGDLLRLSKPKANATHARITRNSGASKNIDYFALNEAGSVALVSGDEIEFTTDKKQGTITVRVEGEHDSPQEYVLRYGAKLGDLLSVIQFTERSDRESIQLFRLSVKERQKSMLEVSLKALENSVLTARSATSDEARLRSDEATTVLKWVERARAIQPIGQVYLAQNARLDEFLLENGDIVKVPKRDGLVLVSGEVLFPNAIAFTDSAKLDDYIKSAGGYTQNADSSRVVVAHLDGSFEESANKGKKFFDFSKSEAKIRQGDQILVLPRVDVKSLQITKELTQILYQIAFAARTAVLL